MTGFDVSKFLLADDLEIVSVAHPGDPNSLSNGGKWYIGERDRALHGGKLFTEQSPRESYCIPREVRDTNELVHIYTYIDYKYIIWHQSFEREHFKLI